MAITGNKASEIGDVMIIQTGELVLGLVSLSGYTDVVIGETGTRFFIKEFRYATDGINFSPWLVLNTPNIAAVDTDQILPFAIEYRYTRGGTDPTGDLEFISISLVGVIVDVSCSQLFNNSIFSQLVGCPDNEVLLWCNNVTQKLYENGIVAEYLERNADGNHLAEDEDYLAFWRAVSCFFGTLVVYGRRVIDISLSQGIMKEYLSQRGMRLAPCLDIAGFKSYLNNYYRIIKQRGTRLAFDGGEFEDTICRQDIDEYKVWITDFDEYGWVVDGSSPLYRHTLYTNALIKLYELTEDVVDLNNYPLLQSGFISIVTDGTKETMNINQAGIADGSYAGIGVGSISDTVSAALLDEVVAISPVADYELTFWIKTTDEDIGFSTGFKGFDNNLSPILFKDCVTGSNVPHWSIIDRKKLNKADTWYFIRVSIIGKNRDSMSAENGLTEFGQGNNFQFQSCGAEYIQPFITVHKTAADSGQVKLHDIKVRIMTTPYAAGGHLTNKRFAHIWAKNNNPEFIEKSEETLIGHPITGDETITYPELEEFSEQNLLPYGAVAMWNWLKCI
jgi:hypothetical protein